MAHDFNNLLVSMLGNTDLALAEVPEGSLARELLQRIALAAERAAELTRGMMAYSGQSHITLAPVALRDIVSEQACGAIKNTNVRGVDGCRS